MLLLDKIVEKGGELGNSEHLVFKADLISHRLGLSNRLQDLLVG